MTDDMRVAVELRALLSVTSGCSESYFKTKASDGTDWRGFFSFCYFFFLFVFNLEAVRCGGVDRVVSTVYLLTVAA